MNIDLKNIRGINQLDLIKESIKEVKTKLNGLDLNQTCKIYASFLSDTLSKRHVTHRLIRTTDLGYSYEHYFIIVYGLKNYLLDLTFSQFKISQFPDLIINGFMALDDLTLNKYLKIVTNNEKDDVFTLDGLFFQNAEEKNKII